MISQCPHCKENLRFSKDQQEKISKALTILEKGKHLTLKCPQCKQAIKLEKNPPGNRIKPPAPPNLDWLDTGLYQGEEKVEDVPMALLLHEPSAQKELINSAIQAVGYQVIEEQTAEAAIERMRFVNFACVVYQSGYEETLEKSAFHNYLRLMSMDRRRFILYILIGSEFNTLYNLEAMAYSANLTINTNDVGHIEVILKKAIPEYEELFGPYMEELGAHSKS